MGPLDIFGTALCLQVFNTVCSIKDCNQSLRLENALRNFACLSTNDIIAIEYNNKTYELCVLETKPGNAVSIIECDMNVEFAPPVGYKEPEPLNTQRKPEKEAEMDYSAYETQPMGFVAFSGTGNRLDGKVRSQEAAASNSMKTVPKRFLSLAFSLHVKE
ncbi:hypothetical protein V5799_024429 [Amblyomma americanum]|uniref:Ubiquitin fusion degradation protein UFD1 N-terminal subdomain 2 domain-containing protein n=1 Tax=Amblyomma americanum TaxID=6943 RepID=A0AAQ4EC19_AMBAM